MTPPILNKYYIKRRDVRNGKIQSLFYRFSLSGRDQPTGQAEKNLYCHHDHFKDSNPNIEWKATLDQAEKIGLGTREYELKRIK